MFARKTDHTWLRTLDGKPDEAVLADQAAKDRNMWCTAGFFHAAGYTITPDGATPRLDARADDAVFSFDPIRFTGTGPGEDEWTPDPNATHRFIFHVRDTEHYRSGRDPGDEVAPHDAAVTMPCQSILWWQARIAVREKQ